MTRMRLLRVGMLAGVVVALIVVIVAGSSKSPTKPVNNKSAVATVAALLKGIPQNGNTLGKPTAPVTVTEYGDLVCPICQEFAFGSEQQLIKNEVRSGKVKLVYIDPPFNTEQAFPDYDDALEHSVWATMMRDRLVQVQKLLTDDGSVWVHLDDREVHRCRMVLDEVFGIVEDLDVVVIAFGVLGDAETAERDVTAALEIESGLNDPISVFLTILLVRFLLAPGTATSADAALLLLEEMGGGAALGLAVGYLLLALLRR